MGSVSMQRPYLVAAVMCAGASASLTLVLALVSARSGVSAGQVAAGAAVWFAGMYALVFVLAVITLRTVGVGGAARRIDASGVLVFAAVFAVAFPLAAAADLAWGELLAFACAIAASGVWRALRA